MAVPILPVIEVPPPRGFFEALELLAVILAYALSMIFWVSSLATFLSMCVVRPQRKSELTYKWMKTVFLFVGRLLCLNTFPALFKMHKTRSYRGSQMTREFMVFLDRKVENNLVLISAFCSSACGIFSASAIVFFYYFPVVESGECLEKDQHRRSLFCYSNSSISSSNPVDCAQYNVTELHDLPFQCYAISIPGLGIAVAAALAFAKLSTMGITIYIKASKSFFMMPKNHSQKLMKCCSCCIPQRWRSCDSKICANRIYIYSSRASLGIMVVVSIVLSSLVFRHTLRQELHIILYLYYFASAYWPTLMLVPLLYIVNMLEGHCKQGEYVSFAAEQKPPDPRDWDIDVESGSSVADGQHDKSVTAAQQPPDRDVESGSSTTVGQQDDRDEIVPASTGLET